jgi:hypothetical protein
VKILSIAFVRKCKAYDGEESPRPGRSVILVPASARCKRALKLVAVYLDPTMLRDYLNSLQLLHRLTCMTIALCRPRAAIDICRIQWSKLLSARFRILESARSLFEHHP